MLPVSVLNAEYRRSLGLRIVYHETNANRVSFQFIPELSAR